MNTDTDIVEYFPDIPLPVLVSLILACYVIYCVITTPRNLPKGPFAWPVIGNMWDFTRVKDPLCKTFGSLRQTYGDIFRIYYGRHLIIVISGRRALEEMTSKKEVWRRRQSCQWVTDRLHRQTVRQERWFNEKTWLVMIKKSTDYQKRAIQNFSFELEILKKIKVLSGELKRKENHSVLIGKLVNNCVEDIICDVTLGSKSTFKAALQVLFPEYSSADENIPSVRILPCTEKDVIQQLQLDSQSRDAVNRILTNHRDTYSSDYIRDFTDVFLRLQLEREIRNSGEEEAYIQSVSNLLLTSSDHMSCVLQWALLLVVAHPKVQRKCQEEIDMVAGYKDVINLSDSQSLPYVTATLCEVKRFASSMSLTAPYTTNKATSVGGYSIPEDTIILIDLRSESRDPEMYEYPNEFQPERFLGSSEQINGFGTPMIDESLSNAVINELGEMVTFLFFTNVLKQFVLTKLQNDVLNLEYDRESAPCPAPYDVIATLR